ncbi:MAG: DUF3619 family protein [Betaproteobacteria bacterium]|nr:DUF3619 family protein [Betaproteobacteria bacterium]
MNEQQFTREIRAALDEASGRLPYRVSHRLEQARLAALSRQRTSEVRQSVPLREPVLAGAGAPSQDDHSPWRRWVLTLLPALALIAGLMAISIWNDTETADEIAEIDSAVLTDEVPLSAYTDRGFGVFLKNSREP